LILNQSRRGSCAGDVDSTSRRAGGPAILDNDRRIHHNDAVDPANVVPRRRLARIGCCLFKAQLLYLARFAVTDLERGVVTTFTN
jgi:hypothetical protein